MLNNGIGRLSVEGNREEHGRHDAALREMVRQNVAGRVDWFAERGTGHPNRELVVDVAKPGISRGTPDGQAPAASRRAMALRRALSVSR